MSYKGQLETIPDEIVTKMLINQVEQGNKKDVTVFEENFKANVYQHGFNWDASFEGYEYWDMIFRKYFITKQIN